MKTASLALILAFAVTTGVARGADMPEPAPEPKPKDAVLERYTVASARQDWSGAAQAMREGITKSPANADYHNRYAYALRKGPGPDMNLVFKHYNEALRIDPRHRGAHEYLGEAYLMIGNVAKAREHLAELDKLCFFSCTEYSDLKSAIAAHLKKTASR